jgi:hypothetical protein
LRRWNHVRLIHGQSLWVWVRDRAVAV